MKYNKIAKDIIDEIIYDISLRSGIGDAWEEIDDEIVLEIKEDWKNIIVSLLLYQN